MLGWIGFKPLPQIEPFDGGPYYAAARGKVALIRRTRRVRAEAFPSTRPSPSKVEGAREERPRRVMVAKEKKGGLRAVLARGQVLAGRCRLEPRALRRLKVREGEPVYACPLSG